MSQSSAPANTAATTTTQPLDSIGFILGAITAAGGTIGFVKSGSIPSIAAGLSVGALVSPL